ncbi:carboxymuconolactone decarboxylase family protein [Kiloniella litopenaei]|uniref:carboxymuconolactone decarboxylase family protein n=1 Tax=Kiloniella litopenaei TaxID=1549748 RepID=UPI003BAC0E6F
MSISDLKSAVPEYAKDLKLNITNVLTSTSLNDQQIWGTALASALSSRNAFVIKAINAEAKEKLSAEAYSAAKSAASIMGMNNIYYRFAHLSGNEDYLKLPARLRMNIIGRPGVDKVDFELWSLAVSAINGCGMCIESHEKQVAAGGISKEGIQDAIRIASVMHALAATFDGEDALAE